MTKPTDQDQLASGFAQFVRAELLRKYGGGASDGESLTALLDGGEVREEWGVRLTYDDGSGHDDEWADRTRQFAEDRIAHHHRMRARYPGGPFGTERMWMVTPALVRRFVIVTAAQPRRSRGHPIMTYVCAYYGPPNECSECGGEDPTGTGFCSHDCRQARADREARHAAAELARRGQETAFAAEVERLRAAGHSYEECDRLLAHMPT